MDPSDVVAGRRSAIGPFVEGEGGGVNSGDGVPPLTSAACALGAELTSGSISKGDGVAYVHVDSDGGFGVLSLENSTAANQGLMDRSSKSKLLYRLLERRMPKCRSVGKLRHLYLVWDDWSWGYSIRKIDLSFGDPDQQLILLSDKQRDAICTGMHRLPPALFRFQGRCGEPKSIMGVVDGMILAMPPLDYRLNSLHGCTVIDIHAKTFINCPWCPDLVNPICIPVGGRLFILDGSSCWMLYQADDDAHYCHFVWKWLKLPVPIVQFEHISSYAVHPDERTIFVSKLSAFPVTLSIDVGDPATFAFEEPLSSEWKEHGMWQLPFTGCGYFDPELDAWVGLSAQMDTIGHICSCDVVSTNSNTSHRQCPALKVSKEKLFSEVPAERHIGATLVYMGGESKFCLLEGIYIQAGSDDQPTESNERNEGFVRELSDTDSDETSEYSVSEENETDSADETNEYSVVDVNQEQDQNQKRFLRLTTFSLKYDKNGDLTTGNSRRTQYYSVPHEVADSMLKHPVAFWM